RRKGVASTRNAKAWRARSLKACGPSACAGRAIAAWPRRACSTSRQLRPSISTVLLLGSRADPSHPLASRALLHSRRNRPIRQRCPPVFVTSGVLTPSPICAHNFLIDGLVHAPERDRTTLWLLL